MESRRILLRSKRAQETSKTFCFDLAPTRSLILDFGIFKCRASAFMAAVFALPSRGGALTRISK